VYAVEITGRGNAMTTIAAAPQQTRQTVALARFVHELRYEDLPASVVDRIKVYTLDCLACGFVGAVQPWSGMVRDMVLEAGGTAEASCFSTKRRVTMPQAALVNGVMIGGFESEHIGYNAHPAGTVFPAAFAVAETGHKSGREFIAAMAAGYEVVCRLGDAQTNAVEIERGFHNPAVNGPYGAAAAAGRLLHLDLPLLVSAFGVAGSHSAGIVEYAWGGEMTKRLHLGRAAQWGLESVQLAGRGFTGPATIIEGPYGFFNAYSPAPKPERLLDGIGKRWLLEHCTIKAYPCHATCQPIVGAIQQFKQSHPIDGDDVSRIVIRAGAETSQQRFLNRTPDSLMGAQYSVPFTVALALYRDLDDPINYDESALADRRIRRLTNQIHWEEDDSHDLEPRGAADIELTIGGETYPLVARSFKGAPSDPLTFADAEAKFRRFTRSLLTIREQTEIVNRVHRLERATKVRPIAKLLRDRWTERLSR
jgi:2-methylcitrate dehydratase PrpD